MVAMNRIHGEGRQAHRNVFSPAFAGSRVTNPFSGVRDDSLASAYFQESLLVVDAQRALKNNGELVKRGRLAGLKPSLRAAHVGHAGR